MKEQFEALHKKAKSVEQAVLEDNIYKEGTFNLLIDLENIIIQIRESLGIDNSELFEKAGIRDPFDILDSALGHWDKKLNAEHLPTETDLVTNLIRDFRVKIRQTKAIYIPPDQKDPSNDTVHEEKEENRVDYNRVALTLQTILNHDFNGEKIMLDDIAISVSSTPTHSFRTRPYWEFNLKKLGIVIFTNNQHHNRTFVVLYHSDAYRRELRRYGKKTLKSKPRVKHFVFHNPEQFVADLKEALDTINSYVKMDGRYFSNPEFVKKDLYAFASAAGIDPNKLNTKRMRENYAQCSNGETINQLKYLKQAAKCLPGTLNYLATLNQLKELAGLEVVPPMDDEYFSNISNIKHDLQAYAEAVDQEIEEISISKIAGIEVKCANNEQIKGQKYLLRAGVHFKLATTMTAAASHQSLALKKLKEKLGIKTIFKQMDKEYFNDKDKVKNDLTIMAEANGISIEELTTTTELICRTFTYSNGQTINGNVYLSKAAIAYGLAEESIKAGHIRGPTLKKLKEVAGMEIKKYDEMDQEYFKNADAIKFDLQAFATEVGVEKIEDLNTQNMSTKTAVCANQESVRGQAYLCRATIALGLVKDKKKAGSKQKKALDMLKTRIGIQLPPAMDSKYFKKNLATDLAVIADQLGTSIDDLTFNALKDTDFVCASGKKIKSRTYIFRATMALGIYKSTREAQAKTKNVMNSIKEFIAEHQ